MSTGADAVVELAFPPPTGDPVSEVVPRVAAEEGPSILADVGSLSVMAAEVGPSVLNDVESPSVMATEVGPSVMAEMVAEPVVEVIAELGSVPL